jgi:uncharacterized membrane protein YbhN (UPF0104 family)
MTKRQRQAVSMFARLVLCAIFVVLAVHGVTLHDRVTLKPDPAIPGHGEYAVRLVALGETTVTVRAPEGSDVVLPRERIAIDAEGEERIERGLGTAFASSDPWILGLAIAVFAPVMVLQPWRLLLMLRAQQIHLTFWECVKLSFGGNFLNFAFPIGSTGGDVFKAYYTAQHTPRKTEAVMTIVLDRIVGLSGLLVVAGVMSFCGTSDRLLRQLGLFAWLLLGCFFVGACMVSSPRVSSLAPKRILAGLPGISHLKRMHGAAERLIEHRMLLFLCLLISVVLQFIAVGVFVICAYALHMDFSENKTWDYFAYIGGGQLVAAIPVSILGLGTMELAYKKFFLGAYGTLPQLLCLALWVRLVQLIWSLPGAVVTLFGAYRPRATDLEEEIHP